MTKRILGISLAIIGLMGVVAYAVVFFRGMHRYATAPARLKSRTSEASDLVPAVFKFRQQVGSWPATINALVPKYLTTPLPDDWEYSGPSGGFAPRLTLRGEAHTRLVFQFPEDPCVGEAEWDLSDEGNRHQFPFAGSLPQCPGNSNGPANSASRP